MSGRYLTDLADVLRRAGLRVIEQDGWQKRARSSGGYSDSRPWCVMWHHTASGANASASSDASYMSYGSENKPVANLMIARNGEVWVLAAGATNTNGKGNSRRFSKGTVPADSMNSYAVGMEIQNTGVGQAYSVECINAAFGASLAVCAAYGLAPDDVDCHHTYAPGRKIDPATAAAVQGGWRPSSVNSSGSWSLDDLRAECRRRAAGTAPTPTPPTPGDDTVIRLFSSQTEPKEYNALFFAECDAQGRSIELQWSGSGDDPAVQERIAVMQGAFGDGPGVYGSWPLLLAGVKNNRLHPKHRPSDIVDSIKAGGWGDQDFAP